LLSNRLDPTLQINCTFNSRGIQTGNLDGSHCVSVGLVVTGMLVVGVVGVVVLVACSVWCECFSSNRLERIDHQFDKTVVLLLLGPKSCHAVNTLSYTAAVGSSASFGGWHSIGQANCCESDKSHVFITESSILITTTQTISIVWV